MTEPKQKTAIGKFLSGKFVKNIAAPVIRGLVKQVPIIGTPLIEVISNLTQPKTEAAVTAATPITAGEPVEVVKKPKHSYVSIATQGITAIVILWAFYTHQITVQGVIDLLKQIV